MIISHKYKFLFIGLPFSASSAITKELNKEYEGKPLLRKHSLYQEFLKIANDKEKKYFVFAVLRNPLDITVTVYEKMKSNYIHEKQWEHMIKNWKIVSYSDYISGEIMTYFD